jgi:hypothetical protein
MNELKAKRSTQKKDPRKWKQRKYGKLIIEWFATMNQVAGQGTVVPTFSRDKRKRYILDQINIRRICEQWRPRVHAAFLA